MDQGTNTRGTNILNDTSNATDNEFCKAKKKCLVSGNMKFFFFFGGGGGGGGGVGVVSR